MSFEERNSSWNIMWSRQCRCSYLVLEAFGMATSWFYMEPMRLEGYFADGMQRSFYFLQKDILSAQNK